MAENNEMPSHHGVDASVEGEYPNETMRLLLERSSCRSFEDRKVPADILKLLFEAATHAATGGNLQPYSIIKVEDPQTRKRLAKLSFDQEFVATAPVDLIFCIDWRRMQRWAELEVAPFAANSSFRHFWIGFQDVIIAAQNVCTAADAMGLGSCYVGTIMENLPTLREMFKLPDGVIPVVLLSLGYPKHRPQPKRKLDISVIVHDEKYNELEDDVLVEEHRKKYPNLKVEITDDRLDQIAEICRRVSGPEMAEKCLSRIKETGYINPVQRYFGLHYVADGMAEGNEEFVRLTEEFGFGWFKKWEPVKDRQQK